LNAIPITGVLPCVPIANGAGAPLVDPLVDPLVTFEFDETAATEAPAAAPTTTAGAVDDEEDDAGAAVPGKGSGTTVRICD